MKQGSQFIQYFWQIYTLHIYEKQNKYPPKEKKQNRGTDMLSDVANKCVVELQVEGQILCWCQWNHIDLYQLGACLNMQVPGCKIIFPTSSKILVKYKHLH